jgi:hypothetical protein
MRLAPICLDKLGGDLNTAVHRSEVAGCRALALVNDKIVVGEIAID